MSRLTRGFSVKDQEQSYEFDEACRKSSHGNFSEFVRTAIINYIDKLKRKQSWK